MDRYYKLLDDFDECESGTVFAQVGECLPHDKGERKYGVFSVKKGSMLTFLPLDLMEKATEKEYFQSRLKYG